jgi:hypothetical protein
MTPAYTTLDHFIVVNGSRTKDKSIVTDKNLTITMTFDEISLDNLEKFLMATDDDSTAGSVLTNVAAEGSAVLVYKSTYGVNFLYAIPRVSIIAEGDMAFSGEAWIKGGLKMTVLALTGYNPNNLVTKQFAKVPGLTSAAYGWIQTEASFATFNYRLA